RAARARLLIPACAGRVLERRTDGGHSNRRPDAQGPSNPSLSPNHPWPQFPGGRAVAAPYRGVVFLFAVLAVAGCSKQGGPSDYEKMMQAKQGATDSLASSGAKVQEKQYPLGKAWVVDLRGLTITENLLKEVKKLGNIAELDLGK